MASFKMSDNSSIKTVIIKSVILIIKALIILIVPFDKTIRRKRSKKIAQMYRQRGVIETEENKQRQKQQQQQNNTATCTNNNMQ